MHKKAKLLVDCDGVMAKFTEAYLREFHRIHGRTHHREEVTTWNFSQCICTPEEDQVVWDYFARTPGLIEALDEESGLLPALERLRQNFRVVCVTSPKSGNKLWAGERAAWLAARGFTDKDIVQTDDKAHVLGDLLLDDGVHNLDVYGAAHYHSQIVVFDQPWNRSAHDYDRVADWASFVDLVEGLFL